MHRERRDGSFNKYSVSGVSSIFYLFYSRQGVMMIEILYFYIIFPFFLMPLY